jgi:outer membrane protein assembly factor BamB
MAMKTFTIVLLVGSSAALTCVVAEDWPTWRHDSQRSASSAQELAGQLHLQWWREYPPLKPAWPEDPRLYFDAHYEPIVMGQTMFLSSSRNDSVTAIDTESGQEFWKFFADGPVRFAPVAAGGRIYFGADDGCLYCLDAATGHLLWKHDAAPTGRRVLGNERLISVWPVRGGPVLDDGKIYFTVGVWPFEGTFLCALDAESGQPVPPLTRGADERTGEAAAGSGLLDLPVVTLKDKTPQGYLAMGQSKLFIPCGRSFAACLDRETGQFVEFNYSTSITNYHVCTSGTWLFHGLITFNMASQETAPVQARQPVLSGDRMYVGSGGSILAYDLAQTTDSADRKGTPVEKPTLEPLGTCPIDVISGPARDSEEYAVWIEANPVLVDLRAGNRLYGHQKDTLFAVDLVATDLQPPKVTWTQRIDGTVASMISADGKLFVVTDEGRIYCFGERDVSPTSHPWEPRTVAPIDDAWATKATRILEEADVRDGYCLVLGIENGQLIKALASQSSLQIIGVDADAERIHRLRRQIDELGQYGARVALHVGDPLSFQFPPYLANLVVSEDWGRVGGEADARLVSKVFSVLRPYGGTVIFDAESGKEDTIQRIAASRLPSAEVARRGQLVVLKRVRALPGAADWTHEYGDAANTLMSVDQRVEAPLGVLWFGGPAGDTDLFYQRHFWGPSIVVVDGRMFIQGPGKLAAVDIYTGRMLWKNLLSHNEHYNPGRRGNDFDGSLAGFHLVGASDGVYIVLGKEIVRLDPASGDELGRFPVPGGDGEWGRIRLRDDLLIASIFRDTETYGSLPVELVGLDRRGGEIRWSRQANLSFPVVAVGQDTVFCYDGALDNLYRDWERRGEIPKAAEDRRLRAWDVRSGADLWQNDTDMIATWMSYSQAHDALVVSSKSTIAALRGKDGSPLWDKQAVGIGFEGHPENLWDKVILWNDRIIDQRGPGRSYDLATGEAITNRNPITGETADWQFTRQGHHCNYVIANPHLLTFRSECAGFCDIETAQTSRLRGFRTGCRNSLIPAGGVLNAPNFAHGCSCGYALFTSLGLVHRPQADLWNYSALTAGSDSVKRVGVNFGAPGDRLAKNGVLWLDYPNVGGSSPEVPIEVTVEAPRWFQLHSTFVEGDGPRWVSASGLEGAGSLKIGLQEPSDGTAAEQIDRQYTVGLHFVEPTATEAGQRIFGVDLEGQPVLTDLDVFRESGGRNRSLVKRFQHVRTGHELEITLRQGVGRPVIAGVEIIAEGE